MLLKGHQMSLKKSFYLFISFFKPIYANTLSWSGAAFKVRITRAKQRE